MDLERKGKAAGQKCPELNKNHSPTKCFIVIFFHDTTSRQYVTTGDDEMVNHI